MKQKIEKLRAIAITFITTALLFLGLAIYLDRWHVVSTPKILFWLFICYTCIAFICEMRIDYLKHKQKYKLGP